LLYALSGMDTPSLGTITFGERVISDLSQDGLAVFRRAHCGFVFQQIYLIDGMSVMDNVLAAGLLVSRDKRALRKKAVELFAAVDIPEETQKKFPSQLSGGEAQRVGIVRALINQPDILFADEPTGALNSKTGLDVLDVLTRFNEQGQSVVMVTHDMRSARRANRILYLKDGVILGECSLGKYVHGDGARHEKLSAFLSEMGW
ncbi:MAG: ABC transporter ATP-binding protein, partial [Lachnospiraceae bacterium]|nr:ABC transporter ATP-binding protein [Lachnospiraceae bacterium]